MRSSDNAQPNLTCDCDIQIRSFANRIEYLDKETDTWKQLYPAFRLYRTEIEIATLLANDGRSLTFKSGCAVSIDGVVYTEFEEIFAALENMVAFFFSSTVVFDYGTTIQRPSSPKIGQTYLDTDLGYPIIWDGTNWINFDGTTV